MQGYNAKDLARSFQTVRTNTIKIAEEIPEDKYSFRPAEGTRTVAETLAHLAVSPRWGKQFHSAREKTIDLSKIGPIMQQIAAQEAELNTKAKLLDALRSGGTEIVSWLETVSDEALADQINMPPGAEPGSKTRFEMLLSMKEHEMHHRGQLMTIERMLGIVPHLTREYQERFAELQKQQQQQKAGA